MDRKKSFMSYLPATLNLRDEDIAALITEYKEYHASPELSLQEFETTRKIRERAENLVLAPGVEREIVPIGETGTVVILRNGEGPVVAYRADIDALPILEQTGLDYASEARGVLDGEDVAVMHGCGHDTHIAMGLKTMDLFARDGESWAGTIEFIFQPGEEGKDGAKLMVSQGLWQSVPRPEALYGQHVFPFTAGTLRVTKNEVTASVDSLKVIVKGKGGHGSQPQDTIDPVILSAYILVRLQSVVSREVGPLDSAVVTCGYLHAGKKENIIPDQAEFRLSIRSASQKIREEVLHKVIRIIRSECQASGADEPEIENYHASNIVMNDVALSEKLTETFTQELGEELVTFDPNYRLMGSEDFGELGDAANIPYTFWMLGGFSDEHLNAEVPISNHSPFFAPLPDPTLSVGVRAAAAAIYSHVRKD